MTVTNRHFWLVRIIFFLSGIVETSYWVEGGLTIRFGEDLSIEGTAGVARVVNLDNLAGVYGWDARVSLAVRYAL